MTNDDAAELDRFIEDEVRIQLGDAVLQLVKMDLGPRVNIAPALVQLERFFRERTTAALTAGWESLQLDAASAGDTLH